jgi:hypothetical protein
MVSVKRCIELRHADCSSLTTGPHQSPRREPASDDHPDNQVHMNCRNESGHDDNGIGPQDPGGKRVNENLHCLTIRSFVQHS